MTAEECRTLKIYATSVSYTRRPAKSINRSPRAMELEMTIFIFEQKKFPSHFESLGKASIFFAKGWDPV